MNMGNSTFDHSTLIINSRTSVVFCEISAGKSENLLNVYAYNGKLK